MNKDAGVNSSTLDGVDICKKDMGTASKSPKATAQRGRQTFVIQEQRCAFPYTFGVTRFPVASQRPGRNELLHWLRMAIPNSCPKALELLQNSQPRLRIYRKG